MATSRKIDLPLDEELIQRARTLDSDGVRKSDLEVVEHAPTMYLGDRAFEDALASGPLDEAEAEQLVRDEIRAARRDAA